RVGAGTAVLRAGALPSNSLQGTWQAPAAFNSVVVVSGRDSGSVRTIAADLAGVDAIALSAQATFRVGLRFGGWFDPGLVTHPLVTDRAEDCADVLGPAGLLRLVPTGLAFMRGVSVTFLSDQGWSIDHRVSETAGSPDLTVFGLRFGHESGSGFNPAYTVRQTHNTLTFSDGPETLRMVAYVL